ncbi:MAG: GNAT family N-acetyltransferase [Chloroflexi bacterium]|nr:GNAT family N-acetyltransferase [Chloroflexota bacterium]
MRVEWFTDEGVFDRLKPEWNDLLRRSVSDTLFLTWEWQTTWWRNLGRGALRIITVRDDAGRLVGLLPLFADPPPDSGPSDTAAPNTLSLIGGLDVSDYLDALVARGFEPSVYAAILNALARPDFPAWDHLQMCALPSGSPTHTQFRAMAERCGYQVEQRLHDVSPLIALPPTWDEYLAALDKKQRHEIRRKLRRLDEQDGRWYVAGAGDDLGAAVADFIRLHQKSHPDKQLFMDAPMQRFFLELAQIGAAHDWLRLEFIEIGGERAAAAFTFVYGAQVLVYNSGYEPQKYGHLGVGMALFALSIRHAIAEGRRVYDFLRGDEEYKYRFGAQDTNVYELHVRNKSKVSQDASV